MRNCQNKNTNKKANCGGNQNWKTTQMLTKKTDKEDLGDVMMKLEGKRPMCLEFESERLSQQLVMDHFETHRKFFEEKYSALATAKCEVLWEHMFSVYIELVSTVRVV